ncbi:class I SAM-dependent methyltransferase [Dongia deserti]|uniref:class I SAM-dependent methyltransferase n=1 Tax=Dongia deserti TaxID=2268030 RepID=UPI000E651C1F|nr:class I SAM-dependent methyltransferase [Dongia deserti]
MAQRLSSAELVTRFIDERMSREIPAQQALRAETRKLPGSGMMSRPESDALLQMLIRLTGAKHVIEVGTFTGSGSLAMALALPEDGRIVACDVNAEWAAIGRKHWQQAGIAHKIDLRLAPASETIAALLKGDAAGTFDMAFIDADKTGYDAYYEGCLKLLRQGGLMVLDNMLWSGHVADPDMHDKDTNALRALNLKIKDDGRVDFCLLSADDGILLARKR